MLPSPFGPFSRTQPHRFHLHQLRLEPERLRRTALMKPLRVDQARGRDDTTEAIALLRALAHPEEPVADKN